MASERDQKLKGLARKYVEAVRAIESEERAVATAKARLKERTAECHRLLDELGEGVGAVKTDRYFVIDGSVVHVQYVADGKWPRVKVGDAT